MKACEINVKDLNLPTMAVELNTEGVHARMFRVRLTRFFLYLAYKSWPGPSLQAWFVYKVPEENEEQSNSEKP